MMRNAALTALAMSMLAGAALAAGDTYDIKVYPCARAQGPITLDGTLDEPSWQAAPLVGSFTYYNRPEMVDPQTFFRVLYDTQRLYFGIVCDEPQMKKVVSVAQARDAREVFASETIEIFVDPKHTHTDYYQFAVNVAGSMYDSRGQDAYWNADIAAGTAMAEDHWTLEFAIPFSDLGIEPQRGALMGFNVCRDRQVVNARQWSNWAQTKANFHDPDRFGHLVLSPTAMQIGQMGAQLRKGDRQGSIVIYSKAGFSQKTYRSLAKQSLDNLDVLLAKLEAVMQHEADDKTRVELGKLVNRYRNEVSPMREVIASQATIDAAEWTRMDLRSNQLTGELDDAVWQARLLALLSTI